MLKSTLFTLLLCFSFGLYAQMPAILTLEEEARLKDEWLEKRVQHILPQIMQREGIDMWLLISREYNEDPVLKTFLPSGWLSARRTTMLVIYDTGDGLETLACARYNVGSLFQKAWDKETQPDQWAALAGLIAERDPQRIAINRSEHFGLADGLSSYHYEKLLENLPEQYSKRLIDGERLAIGWLESRLPEEMVAYRQVMRIAHQIIAEGLSEKVITPGVTSTAEVGWWYRERIRE
ncbi:MAG: Xaa-Pro aminopeptidase, partial [Bacteroidota bacterium]